MLRKRYTKMRRVKRRSTVRRPRKTGIRSAKPEMKIWTGIYTNLEIMSSYLLAGSVNLPGSHLLITDSLVNIVQGTGADQRIGNRIFVKKIQYSVIAWLCPEGNSVTINSALLRYNVVSAGWEKAAGTSLTRYFDSIMVRPMTGSLNRRLYSVWKDRYVHMNSAWPAATDAAGDPDPGNGMIKHFNININVNKNVKFTPGVNQVSDESSSYSLALYAQIPSQPQNTEARAACCSVRVRIWYTDD